MLRLSSILAIYLEYFLLLTAIKCLTFNKTVKCVTWAYVI